MTDGRLIRIFLFSTMYRECAVSKLENAFPMPSLVIFDFISGVKYRRKRKL